MDQPPGNGRAKDGFAAGDTPNCPENLFLCMLQIFAGLLVWRGSKAGAILAFAQLPAAGVFWWGFALPFGPIFALISTVLILLNWGSLR